MDALSVSQQTTLVIADVRFSVQVSPSLLGPVELPISFEPFLGPSDSPDDIAVLFNPTDARYPAETRLVYESGLNWRLRAFDGVYRYEWYHPPSSSVLLLADWIAANNAIQIGFDFGAWRHLEENQWRNVPTPRKALLPPFEQLPFVAPLVSRDTMLVHACGAVKNGRAFVFAGHSGDGKTTLAGLLASEGFELLSDERVAIRRRGSSFIAYGTPWPGEGNVVNAAGFPLAGVFLLHKANEHQVRNEKSARLASEFLARTIVPYYLRSETELVLSLLKELTRAVPFMELHFAKKRGVEKVLVESCSLHL